MRYKQYRVIFRIVLLFLFVFIAFFNLNTVIPFSGVKVIHTTFDTRRGDISLLHPSVRLLKARDGGGGVELIGDPVYIDIRSYVPFEKMSGEVVFRNETGGPVRFGVLQNEDPFRVALARGDTTVKERGRERAYVALDVRATPRRNNAYRFIFSVPSASREHPFRLWEMSLRLEREPLIPWIWHNIKKFFS